MFGIAGTVVEVAAFGQAFGLTGSATLTSVKQDDYQTC